jgi:hypothetical protein
MTETMLKFEGRVTGQFELERMFAYSPKIFAKYYAKGLGRERRSFVGDHKKSGTGTFQTPYLRRALWGGRIRKSQTKYTGDPGAWSKAMLSGFRGKIYGGTPLMGLTLEMGFSKTSKFRPIIELMTTGGSVSAKGKYMIVPVYANLMRYLSYTAGVNYQKVGDAGIWLARVSSTLKQEGSGIFVVKKGEYALFYDSARYKMDPHAALLFVGFRRVTIKKTLDFEEKWKAKEPKAIQRLAGDIDKAAAAINRGQFA